MGIHPLRLLLVEDSEADVELTRDAFDEARILVDMTVAKDGAIALEMLEASERGERPVPELVLLDLNLPKVGGLEVLGYLKSRPCLAAVHVIALTSSRSPTDLHTASALGADRVLHKPFDAEGFLPILFACTDYWISIVRPPD